MMENFVKKDLSELDIEEKLLIENPKPRLAVSLVLDTSLSMSGDPIRELNKGVECFYHSIAEHPIASLSAEVSVVTFGGKVSVLKNFSSVSVNNIPHLTASGMTPMGEAMNKALILLANRKNQYKKWGVEYYQPWIVLMSDGAPNDRNYNLITSTISEVRSMVSAGKLSIFSIGIGDKVDMDIMNQYSIKGALKLKSISNFTDFFEFLGQSIAKVSNSNVGDKIKLDTQNISTIFTVG